MSDSPTDPPLARSPSWTAGQYAVFRLIFGTWLCLHFAQLVPWGAELFSSQGVLPDASSSPLAYLFPNVLTFYDPPWFVTALLALSAVLAACFALGWRDRAIAIVLWYLWACFFGRNPLTSNPGLPYTGVLLLAHAIVPRTPPLWRIFNRREQPGEWFMPRSVWLVVWTLMAVGYSYSGLTKLTSPSWLDGSAIAHVLENPLARPTALREVVLSLPQSVLQAMTWSALGLEIAYAPLALFRRIRPWLWLAGLSMHLSLMLLIDFADLSMGMVMLHLFTFDPAWLRTFLPRKRTPGVGALC